MMAVARAGAAVLLLLLAGCLEVDQHPAYADGAYAGKKDDLPYQRAFASHEATWRAAQKARNELQNEYRRTKPI